MTYEAPLHFCVENSSTLISDREAAFWVEACRLQLVNDVCPAWGLVPPGAALYPKGGTFPASTALVVLLVDDDGDPRAAGLHGIIGDMPYVLIDAHQSANPCRTLSHEFCETAVNQYLGRWTTPIVVGGKAYRYPLEVCDPVEADEYTVPVQLLGEWRACDVSDFVLPSWFDPTSTADKHDHLGVLGRPLELADGGYAAPEVDGEVQFLSQGLVVVGKRRMQSWSRFSRLVHGEGPGDE